MGLLDVVTFILSLVYIFLAIRNNYWCFVIAIVQCTLWAYLDFFKYQLVFDGILQIFYIVMAIWGIYLWVSKTNKEPLPISQLDLPWHLGSVIIGCLVAFLLAYLSSFFMEARMRYLDAITTIFSIIATFMLVYRKVGNWLYFIIVDALYVYIYLKSGSPILAGIMIIYTAMAIIGYYKWRNEYTKKSI